MEIVLSFVVIIGLIILVNFFLAQKKAISKEKPPKSRVEKNPDSVLIFIENADRLIYCCDAPSLDFIRTAKLIIDNDSEVLTQLNNATSNQFSFKYQSYLYKENRLTKILVYSENVKENKLDIVLQNR